MKHILFLFLVFMAFVSTAPAETASVSVRLSEAKAWVGQRLPFFIDLRAPGTFQGTASFDLPQLPGTILIKVGAPVVSSEEIAGKSWFIQSHEFALFSQKAGILEIPAFSVRFASRTGFTGPVSDVYGKFPGMNVTIERPSGTANLGFLITTESFEITETWTPEPGPVEAGAIFKRNIVQRARQLSGMALASAPTTAPDGIRVYADEVSTRDNLERGDFLGERSDTIIYQLTKPGNLTLPELIYVWWNPKTEKMESKTLPARTFDVSPAPSSSPACTSFLATLIWLLISLPGLFLAVRQKEKLIGWLRKRWQDLNPVDRTLVKKLLRACKQNNGIAAGEVWICWRNTQGTMFRPGPELQAAVLLLQRHLYGSGPAGSWQGATLERAFTKHLKAARKDASIEKVSILPQLNL